MQYSACMSKSSREKGKRGELEACEALSRVGIDCRRVPQYANRNGGHREPDVVCDQMSVWFEVKRVERLNPYAYLDQAMSDSRGKMACAVLMRPSHRPWTLLMRLDDLPRFVEEYLRARSSLPVSVDSPEAL
jgi:Holliday junction resolvase